MSDVERAALRPFIDALRAGEVVALPTDTVYGIGALAADPDATRRLFALKERPEKIALAVLVANLESARALCRPDLAAFDVLGAHFWPGALTIVVPRREGLGFTLGGDESTIGLRCPGHELLRSLLAVTGPLAVTSANRHREPPARTAEEVRMAFGPGLRCLDGGPMTEPPSTVVALTDAGPRLLRAGAIVLSDIERVLDSGAAAPAPRPEGS